MVTAPEGGETIIHGFGKPTRYPTTTPGFAVLFRKDLEHESAPLTAGRKHIVSLNLWAIKKQQQQQKQQVLFVTFPEGVAAAAGPGASALSAVKAGATLPTSLQQAADSSRSIVMPAHLATGMLAAHVDWANDAAEARNEALRTVVPYECTGFTYEQVSTVVRVMQRAHVTEVSRTPAFALCKGRLRCVPTSRPATRNQ